MEIFENSSGQLSFLEQDFIKDADCSILTPVTLGRPDIPVYGTGKQIKPRVEGRKGSSHFEKIYLDRLEQLGELEGKRLKFPAKGGTHQGRWCSGSLKAAVQESVTSNLDKTKEDVKVLVVSGERRGESSGRAMYNEMEIHRTNAEKKSHRIVHQWRPVIDYSEKDVWEVLKRHNVNPHPCYRAGWNRCSCAQCIFSTPKLFAGIRDLYPEEYAALKQDEMILGFTLDNKYDLDTFVGDAKSCVYHGDARAIYNLITGEFMPDEVYVEGEWKYPAGAFHGAEGGPC